MGLLLEVSQLYFRLALSETIELPFYLHRYNYTGALILRRSKSANMS